MPGSGNEKHEIIICPAQPKDAETKLCDEDCFIRTNLFANSTLEELVQTKQFTGGDEALSIFDRTMGLAQSLAKEGKMEESVLHVVSLLRYSTLEARQELCIWKVLREFGVMPGPTAAKEILAVVLEIPSRNGVTTLAAYVDGSARYIAADGAFTLFDNKHPFIVSQCHAMLDASVPMLAKAAPRTDLSYPAEEPLLTLCTRGGLFSLDAPPRSVTKTYQDLMLLMAAPHGPESSVKPKVAQRLRHIMEETQPPQGAVSAAPKETMPDATETESCTTLVCRSCVETLPHASFTKRVLKNTRKDPSYKPICTSCNTSVNAITSVISAGYHQSLVMIMAKTMQPGYSVDDLREAVAMRHQDDEDCAICSFPFTDPCGTNEPSVAKVTMVLRPCCRQPICLQCDEACHGKAQPCAFCRGQLEVEGTKRARRPVRHNRRRTAHSE